MRVTTRMSPGTPSVKVRSPTSKRPRSNGKPTRLHDIEAQCPLLGGREPAREHPDRPLDLGVEHFRHQGRQAPRQRGEGAAEFLGEQAGGEFVGQRVVGLQPEMLPEHRGATARQLDHLGQMRRQHLEVTLLARLQPLGLGAGDGAREARDQRWRRRDRMIPLAAHLAQVGDLPVLQVLPARLGTIDQPRHARRAQQGVAFGLECRQLFAAHIRAGARHGDGRVPAQQRQRAAKRMQPAEFLLELLVRCEYWHGGPSRDRVGAAGRDGRRV